MNETVLVSELTKRLRTAFRSFIIFKHADRWSHGVPDLSITGNHCTTWLEVKYANPSFDSEGIQELTMLRLAATSFARYIIYDENRGERRTLIVEPKDFKNWRTGIAVEKFDHDWIIDIIRKVHA